MKTRSVARSAGTHAGRVSVLRRLYTALAAAACGALIPAVQAANLTLSPALLDSLNSSVDFSQSTIGSGSLAITNTLGPGDTVFIQAHTRKRLYLKNLTQGTTANPITITNSGGSSSSMSPPRAISTGRASSSPGAST